jgi:hypothetical protein
MNDKIALAYCHNGMVDEPFMESTLGFLAFDANNRKQSIGCLPERGLYIEDNRNNIVRYLLQTDADWLLMLDTDIEFKPQQVYELFDRAKANDWPIASGIYFSHILDGRCRAVWFDQILENGAARGIRGFTIGEVYKLAAVGMGFCLVRRDVFETIAKVPEYAADTWTWFSRDLYGPQPLPAHYGEDVGFCVRARKCDFQIYGDTTVAVDHWKKVRVNLDTFTMHYHDAIRRGDPY